MNLKAIKDRIAALLTDKSSGIHPEFIEQLSDIVKRIEDLLRDKRGECNVPGEIHCAGISPEANIRPSPPGERALRSPRGECR